MDFEDELHTAQSPTTIKPQYQNQSSPSSNTMDGPEKISFNRSARPLRAINILAFIPGISLLLVSALVTPVGALPLIAIAPLALSTILGLVCIAGDDRPMPWTMYADLCLAMFFVSVLVPMYVPLGWLAGWLYLTNVPFDSLTIFLFCNCFFRWITLALYPKYRDTSESLLSAYSTMPLIVDLYVSCHCPCRALFSSFLSTDSVET